MKKILVIAALALVSFAHAQKGTVLVAGSIDYNSIKQGGASSSSFGFSPKVGYQFTDNLTAGLEASIRNIKDENDNKDYVTKFGAFLRYAQSLGGVFSAYADLGLGMQNEKFTPSGGDSFKGNGFYTGITPALAINLRNSLCLNFSVGGLNYSSVKEDADGAEALETFNFNFGQAFSVGLSKNF